MRPISLAIFLGSTALACSAAMAQAPDTSAKQNPCDSLLLALEHQQGKASPPLTVDQARTYQANNNQQACRDALQRVQTAGSAEGETGAGEKGGQTKDQQAQNGGRIVVRQPSPAVRVEQANPQVTVNQPQPQVTVHQRRPEITVRMPPPNITVQQPQPEIVVRMPNPEVNVKTPQPKVAVNQPQPKVQIEQPDQRPDVQVDRAQAQVNVEQQAQGQQAAVRLDGAQEPQVKFEQTGKPNIQYNMTGKPKVTFQQADADPAGGQNAAPAQHATGDPNATTGAVNGQQANVRPLAVERLKDMKLYNVKGNDLGDVEKVVQSQQDKTYIVLAHGGFLGLGEKRVAIPLANVWKRGDRLVTRGLTDDEIKAMPDWKQDVRSYRELDDRQSAQVSLAE